MVDNDSGEDKVLATCLCCAVAGAISVALLQWALTALRAALQ